MAEPKRAAVAAVPRVAVLMATKDGERFLEEQLQSLAAQSWPSIDLWVSDDGSSDGTRAMVSAWARRWTKGAIMLLDGPAMGFARNFRALIANRRIEADYFAFCDQDDIWNSDKLATAIAWLEKARPGEPRLFCSRTLNISEDGAEIGFSPLFRRPPTFRNALVQSIAGGNTMVFNRAARDAMASASDRAPFVSHDWWAYLVVSGVGGAVNYSARPLVRCRQHGGNQVGANASWRARRARIVRLFQGQFADWTDSNLYGLQRSRDLLTDEARGVLDAFAASRRGGMVHRLRQLKRSGVYRQRRLANLLLWGAVALGWL